MENRIIVEHKHLGTGEILQVTYDTGNPIVSIQWDNGHRSQCGVDELEFLVRRVKVVKQTKNQTRCAKVL